MYGRTLEDQVLEFGHEGVLYRNSFMMYDKQTESLWLHVTGEALKGKLKGKQLEFLPSEVTTWQAWRQKHPETKVLLGRKARGPMGTFGLKQQSRHFGLSLGQGRDVRLYQYALLAKVPVFNHHYQGKAVVLVYHQESSQSVAYAAEAEGQPLSFHAVQGSEGELLMLDGQTRSLWDGLQGICLAGPMKGQRLNRLPATPWLTMRWRNFFPEGEVIGLPKEEEPAPKAKSEGTASGN
ncbi:MAG: DUF3179 domain-containing protein [Planctomycetota bacterium]|nr:MAG: DUF3179 domain-containing protein [Planctomycetota bacterium]